MKLSFTYIKIFQGANGWHGFTAAESSPTMQASQEANLKRNLDKYAPVTPRAAPSPPVPPKKKGRNRVVSGQPGHVTVQGEFGSYLNLPLILILTFSK